MSEELYFLDDESLTSNLGDNEAKRIINWLIGVNKKAPQDIEKALYLIREINLLFKDLQYFDCHFCEGEIQCSEIFEKIMSQLEDKYVGIE